MNDSAHGPWVHRDRPWELPAGQLCPESTWLNRRQMLASLGFFGASSLLPACTRAEAPVKLQAPWPAELLARIPGKHNTRYDPERSITPEAIGSVYNNFYELSTNKDAVVRLADSYAHRPWTVEVVGECHKARTFDIDTLLTQFTQ